MRTVTAVKNHDAIAHFLNHDRHFLCGWRFAGTADGNIANADDAAGQFRLLEYPVFVQTKLQANSRLINDGEDAQYTENKPLYERIIMTMCQLEQILRDCVAPAKVRTAFLVNVAGVDLVMVVNTAFGSR